MIDSISEWAPTLTHWLVLSTALFSIGLYGLLSRRNAISLLISLELMLNSCGINFIAFNRFVAPNSLDGEVFVLFIIAVAAAEAVVALAIFVALFHQKKTLDITQADLLKG